MVPTGSSNSSQKSSGGGGGSSGTETGKTCHCLCCVGSGYWCVQRAWGGGGGGVTEGLD